MTKATFYLFGLFLIISILCSCINFDKTESPLIEIKNDSLINKFQNFPRNWERFGIEENDTVSYIFCNANNPEFNINSEFKTIQIIIGNELYQTFEIVKVLRNEKKIMLFLADNSDGIKSCSFEWIDKTSFVGKWYLNDDTESFYEYLPKKILRKYKVIKEECGE